ncbi:HET domain containing protein [Hyaloscypha variabilis]
MYRRMGQPAAAATNEQEHTFKVTQRVLCSVCYNLDPYQAPPHIDSDKKSWAQQKYIIPAKGPASKIEIYSPEKLRKAAKDGCLYCTLVVAALAGVHPGWETEDTYLFIFLAAGVPAIVCLTFGKTRSVTMTREEASSTFGRDYPEGEDMTFIVASGSDLTPIEVEIYRPIIPEDQLTVGDIAFSHIVENLGFAEEISQHSGDQRCFDFIKQNIATCVTHHKCGMGGALPLLPDRVLWIESGSIARIQLIEPKNIRASYIALSYCWGPLSPNTYLTNTHTLNARKAGIEFYDLPRLFQDVVQTACTLGIEYVWIDRLCIIQGDNEDFQRQADKMDEIYGNATLTIAAASTIDENDRILSPRNERFRSYDLNINAEGIGSVKLRVRRLSYAFLANAQEDYGRMSTRAWTWQERLLAARTVFFTPRALKFECRFHSIWEGFDKDRAGRSWSYQLENMTYDTWMRLVEEFTSRNITRPSDRLPAISAVMRRVSKSTGWRPLWGLWADSFIEGLCWASSLDDQCRMNPKRWAPTWSWASVEGPISYHSKPNKELDENNPMIWDLEFLSLDKASGLIKVAGRAVFVKLHATIEPERRKFKYKYEVRGRNDEEGFGVTPDVPLKPWSGNINGEPVSTAIRVPYGEKAPEQSWTAECLMLLVGNKKRESRVLTLGRSVAVAFAWERIGMTARNIYPATFSSSTRTVIEIV